MSDSFHVILHPAPLTPPEHQVVLVNGIEVHAVKTSGRFDSRFECSFEDVLSAFERLPRMFLEPDGSFVWVIESKHTRHQLDGVVMDDGTQILNVELKGTSDETSLNQLLSVLGWPTRKLLFQLVQHGVYLEEADFRRMYTR